MQFFAFHLMPWDRLPADFETKYESAWTWLPNSLYDPVHGHTLYNRYLDELLLAEELGFDGVCVNEHHQNAYGTMPSPNLMGAILARQTQRVKIAVIGNALPLYNPPTRVAEEFAMIDVISGGRLIAGMVVGGGPEYYSFTINPTFARSMYSEALDLVLRAWTEPGPFEHYGKHWQLKYVNPWPRPLQQPHPPIWIPGAGSQETIEFVAQRRYSLHGHPVLPHRFLPAEFRQLPRGVPEGRLHGRSRADGLAAADLRGRDRRAGVGGIRAAPVVLRPQAAQGADDLAAGLHQRPVDRSDSRRR